MRTAKNDQSPMLYEKSIFFYGIHAGSHKFSHGQQSASTTPTVEGTVELVVVLIKFTVTLFAVKQCRITTTIQVRDGPRLSFTS